MINLQGLFPEAAAGVLSRLGNERLEKLEELRLRAGRETIAKIDGKYYPVKDIHATPALLKEITMRAGRYSLYTVEQPLRYGWIPLAGGGRLGIAATVTSGGIREVSSLCLRIAREYDCMTEGEFQNLYPNGFDNTVIISPPGYGKTTLLRSMIRRTAESGLNVGVADDRLELAACRDGIPTFRLGNSVDIISGGKRSETMLMLLRSMAPQVIACDEIVTKEDAEGIESVYNSGVRLLTSIHASDRRELESRPVYKPLLEKNIFKTCITISIESGKRRYRSEGL